MSGKKYIPINCGLYDQLEAFAVKRDLLTIQFEEGSKTVVVDHVQILDFKTEKDGEYGILQTGKGNLKIRLDKLIAINGENLNNEFGESCTLLG